MIFKKKNAEKQMKKNLLRSFKAVRYDLATLKVKNDAVKRSAHDWIVHLNHENQELKARVDQLESSLADMMKIKDDSRLSILRQL